MIKSDLLAIKEEYGDARRTQIVDRTRGALTTHDLLPDQEVWVSVGSDGTLRRTDAGRLTPTSLRQAAKGAEAALFQANARDLLFLFADSGRAARLGIHELQAESKAAAEFTGLERKEKATAALALPRVAGPAGPGSVDSATPTTADDANGFLFFATERGYVKRVSLEDVTGSVNSGSVVMNVDDKDRLGWALRTTGASQVLLVASNGQAIRFAEDEVRSMGLPAGGVGGMKLGKNERIVFAGVVEPDSLLMTYTANGFAKFSALADFPSQGRNGGGVAAHKLSARTGAVTAAAILAADRLPKLLALLTPKGAPRVVELTEIPNQGRASQGKQVAEPTPGAPVVAIRWLDGNEPAEPPAPRTLPPRLLEDEAKAHTIPASKAKEGVAPGPQAPTAAGAAAKTAAKATAAPAAAKTTAAPAAAKATAAPAAAKADVPLKQAPTTRTSAAAAGKQADSPKPPAAPKASAPPKTAAAAKPPAAAPSSLPPAAPPTETPAEQPGLFGDEALPPVANSGKDDKKKAGKLKTVTSVKK